MTSTPPQSNPPQSTTTQTAQTLSDSYHAHWHIFIPTLIIAVLYSLAWIALYFNGMSGTSLARLLIAVLAIGVPLLFAHAFLRHQTIKLEVYETKLVYHTGWPRSEPVDLPLIMVAGVSHKRGISGRLFGGGTVILKLITGETIGVADLDLPADAVKKIAAKMALSQQA